MKNVRRRGALIAEEASESQSLAADPPVRLRDGCANGENGGHFKMKNGNRAPCHLINVKPQRGEGTTACGGCAVPGLMSPRTEGGFKWADSHCVTHLSHGDDAARSQRRCCKEVVSSWEVLNNTIRLRNTILQTAPT